MPMQATRVARVGRSSNPDPESATARNRETMPQKRALQLSIAIAALLPVVAGAWGIGTSGDGWVSNHHRYLSGLLLAIGLGYWSALPRIETMGPRLRLLTALVVIGGVARLAGV